MTNATAFFLKHAGWSYGPQTEGRARCAEQLAAAEAWASSEGYMIEWRPDDSSDEPGDWGCALHDPDGQVVESLWGIGFESGEPWGEPYARVVAAELALQAMP